MFKQRQRPRYCSRFPQPHLCNSYAIRLPVLYEPATSFIPQRPEIYSNQRNNKTQCLTYVYLFARGFISFQTDPDHPCIFGSRPEKCSQNGRDNCSEKLHCPCLPQDDLSASHLERPGISKNRICPGDLFACGYRTQTIKIACIRFTSIRDTWIPKRVPLYNFLQVEDSRPRLPSAATVIVRKPPLCVL